MSVVTASVGLSLYPIFLFFAESASPVVKVSDFRFGRDGGVKGVYLRQMGEDSRRLVLT